MSPSTLANNRLSSTMIFENTEVKFQVEKDTTAYSTSIWQQINDILKKSFVSTVPQKETTQQSKADMKPHILVMPGMLLPYDEYKKRFGTIDLEHYRKGMSPDLFRVFVRHIGFITGLQKLDIEKLMSNHED